MDKSMTVAEFIQFLSTLPQDLPVAYRCCSESMLLDKDDIQIIDLCKPRYDGWVQNYRIDMDAQKYLLLPGN